MTKEFCKQILGAYAAQNDLGVWLWQVAIYRGNDGKTRDGAPPGLDFWCLTGLSDERGDDDITTAIRQWWANMGAETSIPPQFSLIHAAPITGAFAPVLVPALQFAPAAAEYYPKYHCIRCGLEYYELNRRPRTGDERRRLCHCGDGHLQLQNAQPSKGKQREKNETDDAAAARRKLPAFALDSPRQKSGLDAEQHG